MNQLPVIVWFRNDLRLQDHPALSAAAALNRPLIPLFIWSPEQEGDWPPGAASRWWLHRSLFALQSQLRSQGLSLILRKGEPLRTLQSIIQETSADTVMWNRCYEPAGIERDRRIKSTLKTSGIRAQSFQGNVLFEPWTIATKQDKPYQVFTPFWKACTAAPTPRKPLSSAPLKPYTPPLQQDPLESLGLLPHVHWDKGLQQRWRPGEEEGLKLLTDFANGPISSYSSTRDFPALPHGVSHLSPYLHFGEISPFQVWHSLKDCSHAEVFLRQLGWREFAHHLLYHFPRTIDTPLRDNFRGFPWVKNPEGLQLWQKGLTGFPIVDAGMRELWQTGWMHNRVRMIVGSFLVKDLLISWQEGARWFWDTLVDADLANNTLGWQWIGGCGADAAPYFRIFNPVLQGEKFDPEGDYVRRWIPELKNLPFRWIHRPWEAPPPLLNQAQVILGETYPFPLVDHSKAREQALAAYQSL